MANQNGFDGAGGALAGQRAHQQPKVGAGRRVRRNTHRRAATRARDDSLTRAGRLLLLDGWGLGLYENRANVPPHSCTQYSESLFCVCAFVFFLYHVSVKGSAKRGPPNECSFLELSLLEQYWNSPSVSRRLRSVLPGIDKSVHGYFEGS